MKPLYVIVMVAVLVALAFIGGRCSAPRSIYAPVVRPEVTQWLPDTARIEQHYYHTVQAPKDTAALNAWQARYDSLLAASKHNADSTLKYLATPWEERHRWKIGSEALDYMATGDLLMKVDPTVKDVQPNMVMDTLHLPKPWVETNDKTTPWEVIAGVGVVSLLAGIYIGTR